MRMGGLQPIRAVETEGKGQKAWNPQPSESTENPQKDRGLDLICD